MGQTYEEIGAVLTSLMKRCAGHKRSKLLCSLFICYVIISSKSPRACEDVVCKTLLKIRHELSSEKLCHEFLSQLLCQANEYQLQLIAIDTLEYVSRMYPPVSTDERKELSFCWHILQEILVIDVFENGYVRRGLLERFSRGGSKALESTPIENCIHNPALYDAKMWSFSSLSSSMADRLAEEIRPSVALNEVREVPLAGDNSADLKTQVQVRHHLQQVWRDVKPFRLMSNVWAEMSIHFKLRTLFGGPTQVKYNSLNVNFTLPPFSPLSLSHTHSVALNYYLLFLLFVGPYSDIRGNGTPAQ